MNKDGYRKIRVGSVVSDKMDKTVVIKVDRLVRHPVFKRIVRKTKKYKVHDEKNECRVGDSIKIIETKPLSKEKRWCMLEIITKAK